MKIFIRERFDVEPILEDPPHPVADASADEVAAIVAQPACPTSQRLPGGLLALKLHNHIKWIDNRKFEEPSTAGLFIFGDRFIGQGTFGQVFEAQYKGENAVAKVFGTVYTTEEPRGVKRQRQATTEERLDAARCEVAASAAFPPNKDILQLVDVCMWRSYPVLIYPRFDSSLLCRLRRRSLLEVERLHVMESLCHAGAHLHAHEIVFFNTFAMQEMLTMQLDSMFESYRYYGI